MMIRLNTLLLLCLLLLAAVFGQDVPNENCGEEYDSSINEINGCNIRVQEQHPCSFQNGLASAVEGDKSTVTFEYRSCDTVDDKEDCSNPQAYVVYGNAVMVMDDLLVQVQPSGNGEERAICFAYDYHDGNSPTADCQEECVAVHGNNFNVQTILVTNEVAGLPTYGSAGRNRHIVLLETGIRSGAAKRRKTTILTLVASQLILASFYWS